MSAANALRVLLYYCEEEGLEAPKSTGHIRVDELCAAKMALYCNLLERTVLDCCEGVPVKEAVAVLGWLQSVEEEDRIAVLRRWRARRDERLRSKANDGRAA